MANILIIDDEKVICEEFRDILMEDDHQVEVAYDGPEGLKKIQENDYDLVFLDVLMPKMEGGEVFQRIKSVKPVAVAIMSGYLPAHKEREVLNQGAVAVFKKPLDLSKIKKLIESITKK